MRVINLTSHEVVLSNGFVHVTFPPSGNVARVEQLTEKAFVDYEVNQDVTLKLPIQQPSPTVKVMNLPKEKVDTYYIVSAYVAQVVKRKDLICPLTDSTAERDSNGKVLSVKAFQQFLNNQELVEVGQ